ncbi:MAG TPA: 6-carboxytetrahydropterin synthase QueD [Bacteroidales bacterium]|nr:6-carboxytetrahydropterin synthase QueD [Bacteroidales bacterium]
MQNIRVTKEFNFEMAHALWNYDGVCKNIHGHSYKLFVTVTGMPLDNPNNPKHGMVIDFGDLKRIVNELIISRFDHAVVFSDLAPVESLKSVKQMFDRIEVVNYQPTCENLLIDIIKKLKMELPANVTLFSAKLHETGTSFAEWFQSDNL